ncbi:UvrD-like DNA helicase ATP-binding domain [Carpediemonas membranifera]|uniref:UvrD-like DNA helicase ATP-binding domain n=1 Tax=Carpediemonas membranifera TaxID=201153 RepID=A0A8J6E1V8_9EUKA|nr:UvrD-like DNA helicase ATP-binding domain [Carpediemonas membranifera]|eukprot:KAG9396849.1 UvrD-like DNA helicase ATP-binding domain [Carpediemonas membranifera]
MHGCAHHVPTMGIMPQQQDREKIESRPILGAFSQIHCPENTVSSDMSYLWAANAYENSYPLPETAEEKKSGRKIVTVFPTTMEQFREDCRAIKARGPKEIRADASMLLQNISSRDVQAFLDSVQLSSDSQLEHTMLTMARTLFHGMVWKNSVGVASGNTTPQFTRAVCFSMMASHREIDRSARAMRYSHPAGNGATFTAPVTTFPVLLAPELSDQLSGFKTALRSEVASRMIQARYGNFTDTQFTAVKGIGKAFTQPLSDKTYLRGIVVRSVNLPLVTRDTIPSIGNGFPFVGDSDMTTRMHGLKMDLTKAPSPDRWWLGGQEKYLAAYPVNPILDTIIIFATHTQSATDEVDFTRYFTPNSSSAIDAIRAQFTSIGHTYSPIAVFDGPQPTPYTKLAAGVWLQHSAPVRVFDRGTFPALTLRYRSEVRQFTKTEIEFGRKWWPAVVKLVPTRQSGSKKAGRRQRRRAQLVDQAEAKEKYQDSLGHMYRAMLGSLGDEDVSRVIQALDLGSKVRLSAKQTEVVTNPGNMVVIGRSGSGKSLSLLLRVAVQYYKLLDLNDEDLIGQYTVVVCTRSHSLLRDLIERWNTLATTLGGKLAAMTRPLVERAGLEPGQGFSESEDMILEILNQSENSLMPGATLATHTAGPVFCTTRKLIHLIDETLERPYFDHSDSAKADNSWGLSAHGTASLRRQKLEMLDLDVEDVLDEEVLEAFVTGDAEETAESYVGMEVTFELFASVVYPLCVFHYRCQHEVKPSKVPTREQCKNFAGVNVSQVYKELMSTVFGSVASLKVGIPAASYIYDHRTSNISRQDAVFIRAIAVSYMTLKNVMQLYDINDVITYIYRQIISHGYHGTPVHSFVVDEAQDSPITLVQLLTQVCGSNMASIVVAGDTAQAIADGIEFRFKDVEEAANRIAVDGKPVSVVDLDVNYRSTSKVCELGNHLINLMKLYPKSIDMTEELSFKRSGSGAAVFFEHASHADLDELLTRSKRELAAKGSIFGAKQAVIVRSYADVPPELERSLVLTVEDAKGLEFDDVLLYNFFTDSPVEAEWHYFTLLFADISAYPTRMIEEAFKYGRDEFAATQDHGKYQLMNAVKRIKQLDTTGMRYGMADGIRSNAKEHLLRTSVIAHELKSLYVAVTRARSRVFFFDSDEVRRTPVMAEWARLGLVQRIDMDEAKADGLAINDEETSAAEWELEAQKYMASLSFSAAMQCYRRVPGMERMVLVCKAISLARSAIERNGGALVTDKSNVVYYKLNNFLHQAMNPGRRNYMTAAHVVEEDTLAALVGAPDSSLVASAQLTEAGQIFMQLGYRRLAARCLAASLDYTAAAKAFVDMGDVHAAAECLVRGGLRRDAVELLLANRETDNAISLTYSWLFSPPAARYTAHTPDYPAIAALLEGISGAICTVAPQTADMVAKMLCFAIVHGEKAAALVPIFTSFADSPAVASIPGFVDIIRLGISLITGSEPHALTDVSSSTRILLAAVQDVPRHVALPCITALCAALADFPLYGMLFQSIMDNDPWAIFESIIDSPPGRVLEQGQTDPNLLIRLATVCDDVRKCKKVSTDDRLLLAQALVECKCHLGLIFAVDDDLTTWIECSIQVTFGGNLKPNVQAPRITPHDCVLAVQVYCAFLALPHLRREDSTVTPAMTVEACVRIVLNDQIAQIMTAQNLGMSHSLRDYALSVILDPRYDGLVPNNDATLAHRFSSSLRSSVSGLFDSLVSSYTGTTVNPLPIARALANSLSFAGPDGLLELGGMILSFSEKTLSMPTITDVDDYLADLEDELDELDAELDALEEDGGVIPESIIARHAKLEAKVANLALFENLWRWCKTIINGPVWDSFDEIISYLQTISVDPEILARVVPIVCPTYPPDFDETDLDYLFNEENERIAQHIAAIHPLPGIAPIAPPEPLVHIDTSKSVQFKVIREEMKREISAMVLAGCTDQGHFEYIESVLDGELEALIEATEIEWTESVKECGPPDEVKYRALFRLYEKV